MPSINFNSIDGFYETNRSHALGFLNWWFEPDELIALTVKPRGNKRTVTSWGTISDWADILFDDEEFKNFVELTGEPCDVYFGINPHIRELSVHQRGTSDNIKEIRGLFADIDVKAGNFSSQEEILSFLGEIEFPPHAVVSSGSGGVHAYWKLQHTKKSQADIYERWWAYLSDKAGERAIDRLIDITRMFRLPGTLRVPKGGENLDITQVDLLHLDSSLPPYDPNFIYESTYDSYKHIEERKKKSVKKSEQLYQIVNSPYIRQLVFDPSGLPFKDRNRLFPDIANIDEESIEYLEETIRSREDISSRPYPSPKEKNFLVKSAKYCLDKQRSEEIADTIQNRYDWEDILIPYGWTLRRTFRDGTREWARPGKKDRSATTDWIDPNHPEYGPSGAMSLLSSSPETGLSDLKEIDVPLTKWRVLLRLKYNDNVIDMISKEFNNYSK